MDFTLDIYREFLEKFLDNGYAFITFDNYCNGEIVDKMVILRHDVDLKPENSVETAIIEAQLGIRASYYFRKRKHGWEIGRAHV